MEIKRYSIPKLPRNKYPTGTGTGTTYSNTVVNNTVDVYDGLDSNSAEKSLSANQGRILNQTKLNKAGDTATGLMTFNDGVHIKGTAVFSPDEQPQQDTGTVIKDDDNGDSTVTSDIITARLQINSDEIYLGDNMTSTDYRRGEKGAAIRNEGTKWMLDIDDVNVRGRLKVETLQIQHAQHIGGKLYCTLAGLRINKVEQRNDIYRCYFKTTDNDGREIYNQFMAGDLAFSQTFNNNSVRRYWRRVTGTGTDFIDLSIVDCEQGSDIPVIGDDVVQLGSINSKKRQGAMIIEPLSLSVYDVISNFELPEPMIRLNPTATRINADTINFNGQTIINGNFSVDEQGNLSIKGKVEADEGYFKGFISKKKTVITNTNYMDYFDNIDGDLFLNLYRSGTFIEFDKSFNISNAQYYLPSMRDRPTTGQYQDLFDEVRQLTGNTLLIYNKSKVKITLKTWSFLLEKDSTTTTMKGTDLKPDDMLSVTLRIKLKNGIECSQWEGCQGALKAL